MYKLTFISAVFLASLAWASESTAQEEEPAYDDNSRTCISTRRIRRTRVIDDRSILFYVTGRDVYHNILPAACNGLRRENRFSYQTNGSQLCSRDAISVLFDHSWGLRTGARCGLGLFHKITREDAKALMEMRDQPPQSNPLPTPEPQEVGSESSEEEPPEPT